MSIPHRDSAGKAALRTEALDWLRRLNSGEATGADVQAFDRWRESSPAHAAEFAEATLFWNVLGDAARKAEDARAAQAAVSQPQRMLARRGFLIGGAALAASAAGVVALRPPLELWPSIAELAADYRTSTGERRKIEIGNLAAVELNTRTSLDLRAPVDGGAQIELIAGEAAVSSRGTVDRELVVIAGNGRVAAREASFNIRKDGASVSVSCSAGELVVNCQQRAVTIRNGQQIVYDAGGPHEISGIDPETVAAWQRGLLIFRRAPLTQVIDEVNRYRSGRVVLLDAALGRRLVVASFRLDRIEDAVDFMSKAMGIRIRSLPGGVVLVG
ncbi:iron dicitrate transport regulator FecR [Bradyrhizobium sp. SK17]|uniref:FecR family protein n=1 Tax=Bradyrhizobium sp. SK17 TaxID=2057741 RepID=UPI000C313335|nr:FecR domain-containing protein [Bradyrhizobium sp. SK17]AUC95050.1 iron dicitrate transport regulator FecR [Bradyrhizobium sp. SK17]